ncbi:768_t:CDS:2, partial [Rhizophagus irregularis]
MSYGQKHKKIQILSCDLSYVDVCISEGIVIDEGACLLLPDEFNGYIYADTTADGNCLYNAQIEYRNITPFVAEIMEMCHIGAWSPLGALYDDDPIEQWKETKVSLEDQIIANGF